MYKTSKKYMPTYILIALNLAVYVYTSIIGNNFIETSDSVIRVYGQVNALVYEGAYWQLFTAMFIHADLLHLFGNMLFLLIFGLRAEELFSTPEYFLIYLLSGLTGNLLTLLLGPQLVSVGASGAIFGMFGAVAIYVRRAIGQSILSALMYAFFLLMISWGPNVNFLAHLGGLVAGLLIGYLLAVKRKFKVVYAYEYRYSY
ncbi:rhomboid family intramembrane serine protease [Candidatus Bathyarchaeota archaeon]|nr:MAG: rhomboid family intramembrane serine protease [Candidatus Bathyarchaeota archaeon]